MRDTHAASVPVACVGVPAGADMQLFWLHPASTCTDLCKRVGVFCVRQLGKVSIADVFTAACVMLELGVVQLVCTSWCLRGHPGLRYRVIPRAGRQQGLFVCAARVYPQCLFVGMYLG